jgi:hypothetical protein
LRALKLPVKLVEKSLRWHERDDREFSQWDWSSEDVPRVGSRDARWAKERRSREDRRRRAVQAAGSVELAWSSETTRRRT